MKRFIWIGFNRYFKKWWASEPMTTTDLLRRNYPTFFALQNRADGGNCEFVGEAYELDTIHFTMKTKEVINFMVEFDKNNKVMLLGNSTKIRLEDYLLENNGIEKIEIISY